MEQREISMNSVKIKDIVQVSLMAAITYVATWFIHIPSYMGVIHLGDSIVFLTALLFGRKKAAVASAVGMGLFDLLNGYLIWAPFTFVIKGGMGYLTGLIAYRGRNEGKHFINNIFACVVAGIWMIAAYYAGGVIILRYILGTSPNINQAMVIALKDVFGNVLQVAAGAVIALPLGKALKKQWF